MNKISHSKNPGNKDTITTIYAARPGCLPKLLKDYKKNLERAKAAASDSTPMATEDKTLIQAMIEKADLLLRQVLKGQKK